MTPFHLSAGPRELATLRIAVFGLWFVLVWTVPVQNLAAYPEEILTSYGVMGLFPLEQLAMSSTALVSLKVATLVGCALCLVGVRPFTPVAIPTVALLLVFDGVTKSIGTYPNHAQSALLVVALLVAMFPAADAYGIPRRARTAGKRANRWRYATPMLASAALMATAYAMIGLRRLVDGGLAVFTDDSLLLWSVTRTQSYSSYPWDFGLVLLDHPPLRVVFAVGFFVATIFEVLSPLALRYMRFRQVWLAVIAPMHVATLVTMKIFFWENLILIAVLFTALPYWIARTVPTSRRGERSATATPELVAEPER